MSDECSSSNSFTGLKRKHKAGRSDFLSVRKKYRRCIPSEELRRCFVRVVKWNGEECVEDHTGPVSEVNLLSRKGNEDLVENFANGQDSDSSATEIGSNSYTAVGISRNNCKGVGSDSPETSTSERYSENSLENPCYSKAVVNLSMAARNSPNLLTRDIRNKHDRDGQHVSFIESTEPVSYRKNSKNSLSNCIKGGKSVSNFNALKHLDDPNSSSSSENENEEIHRSDAYRKRQRYLVDNESKLKSSCNIKKPCIEPLYKDAAYEFKGWQNLDSVVTVHDLKPCSVVLARIDGVDPRGEMLRSQSVVKKDSPQQIKSRLLDSYMKHKRRVRRQKQRNAVQNYPNSEHSRLISRQNSRNEQGSYTSSSDDDTKRSRYDASGSKSRNNKARHYDYLNRNSGSNHNRAYFDESLPSTSSMSFFDEMENNWSVNEYIRNKYPEYFETQQDDLSDSEMARNILNRINEFSLSGFNKEFSSDDYVSNGTEDVSKGDDTVKITNPTSSESSSSSESEEDSDEDADSTGNNEEAHKREMQGGESDLESKSVEEIPVNKSRRKSVSKDLPDDKKTHKKAGTRGTKDKMGETSSSKMPSTSSSTNKHSKKPKSAPSRVKPFHSQFGKQYIVDYFNVERINQLYISVHIQDKPQAGEQNSENKPVSRKCTECGRILNEPGSSEKYEQKSRNIPDIVVEAFNAAGSSKRGNDENLSGSPNPATSFPNDHEIEILSETNGISAPNQGSPLPSVKELDKKVSNDTEFDSSSKSSEGDLSDSTIITVNRSDNCVHCFYTFLNKEDTYNHTCLGKREKGFLCMYCERIFSSDEEFQSHSKMHVISI